MQLYIQKSLKNNGYIFEIVFHGAVSTPLEFLLDAKTSAKVHRQQSCRSNSAEHL